MLRSAPLAWAAVTGAVAAGVNMLLPTYTQFLLGRIALLVIVTLSLNLLIGVAGLLSLASAAFMGVGAFGITLIVLNTEIPLLVGLLLVVLGAWLLGWILGTLSMRLSGFYLALTTLGFLIAFQTVLRHGGTLLGEGYGLVAPRPEVFGFELDTEWVAAVAMFTAGATLVLTASFLRSRTGRSWRALHANAVAAQMSGMNLLRLRTSAFALSAGMAALAGAIYAFLLQAVSPAGFAIEQTIDQLVYVIVGGLGSVWGSLLGPAVLELVPEFLRGLEEQRPLFFGTVLLVVLIVAPRGLAGLFGAVFSRLRPVVERRVPVLRRAEERRHAALLDVPPPTEADMAALRRPERVALDDTDVALAYRDVTVRYGGLVAVDRLDYEVTTGALHGIIGPNGAGKTTAINALCGLVRADEGSILVGGETIRSPGKGVAPHDLAHLGVARTFQTPLVVPDLDAIENVMVGLHAQMRGGVISGALKLGFVRREERAARVLALDALRRVGFESDPTAPVKLLPFGEIRRLEIARALVSSPRLLLLDEPTSGLEMEAATAVLEHIRELQAESDHPLTVVIVEHNVPLLFAHCDAVTAMVQGHAVITGTPDEVRADPQVRSSYLGEQLDVDAATADVGGPHDPEGIHADGT